MRVQEGGPRRNASSAEQGKGQKVWSTIQSNILGDSIDKDTYPESTRQREAMKYLRESCYHRIECSVANSLTTLIRKRYLNSNFQSYSYSPKISGRCWWDKDQHQQYNLYVEGRDEKMKIV